MALKWEKAPNNPKMIELFWEGSLFRTVYKFLFSKELGSIPETVTYEELCSYLAQIEQKGGRRYALWLLSRRAFLSSELEEKLLSKGISQESAERILHFCTERGYLDDAAQMNRLIAAELKKGRSRRAIYYKLTQQKGVNLALLNSCLKSTTTSDEEALDRWMAKHPRALQNTDYDARRKIMQKLSRLGFSTDLIRKKILINARDN